MLSAEGVATRVAEPHIVPCLGGHKSGSDVRIVHDPGVRSIANAMDQEQGRLGIGLGAVEASLDAVKAEDVAIGGCDCVLFEVETVLVAELLE